jgi:hypothetical protein
VGSECVPLTGIQFHRTVSFKQVEFEGITDLNESDTAREQEAFGLIESHPEGLISSVESANAQ